MSETSELLKEIEITQHQLASYQSDLKAHELYLSDFIKRHQLILGALLPVSLYLLWKTRAPKHLLTAATKIGQISLLLSKLRQI